MDKAPVEIIKEHYKFPFEFRPLQAFDINRLADAQRSGWYDEVGVGKTGMATAVSLYKKIFTPEIVVIILMPPVLITQWKRWLESLERKGTPGRLRVLAYRGSPTERRKLSFENAEFVLMSIQIFKRDYIRICGDFDGRQPTVVIVDEATSIKNPGSGNHRAVRDFVDARESALLLLTGTPLSTPADAYGYIKLVSPMIYRNERHFESLHIEERDEYDNPKRWMNLDLLSDNLMTNASRILKQEVLPDLDEPIYIPIRYELSKEHYELYVKLATEQILLLEGGGKIDATTAPKLYNAVQQIVVNWYHFSGNDKHKPAAVELIETIIEEIGCGSPNGNKLMICCNYRMTNRYLTKYLSKYKAVAFFSELSRTQQDKNYRTFLDDPGCWVALVQPKSAGVGLDNFKDVCSDMLFLESPVIPMHFTQTVGRLYRIGQKFAPRVRIGIAEGTIQHRLHERLLVKDQLVNMVQGGWQDLKDAIYGR